RNRAQFWILPQQRLRRLHSRTGEHAFELQCIHCRFGLEVIVGNDISLFRSTRNVLDLLLPLLQLGLFLKVVVAVVAIVTLKPLFVVASVHAYVTDRFGDMLPWFEGTSDDRLI